MFRIFHFSAVACALLFGATGSAPAETNSQPGPAPDFVAIEALNRLKGIDLEANPAVKATVMRVVDSTKGTPQFVELVRDFKIGGQEEALIEFAIAHPGTSAGADAIRLALAGNADDWLATALAGPDAHNVVVALSSAADRRSVPLLEPLVTDGGLDLELRKEALGALVKTQEGAAALLGLAREDALPEDLRFMAALELNNVRWPDLKAEAAQVLPPRQSRNNEPLPPISELAMRTGDPLRGAHIFSRPDVACVSCHVVNGAGTAVGPDLSEIGVKLGTDALYTKILDPNSGIAFGYEPWLIELATGEDAFGLIISETAGEIVLKDVSGITTRYGKSEIVSREKQRHSIMPSGFEAAMTTQELVDLVEYLTTLRGRELEGSEE